MKLTTSIHIRYIPLIIALTGVGTFFLSTHWLRPATFVDVSDRFDHETPTEESLDFYQDSIILASKNHRDPHRFVLELEMNRKETTPGTFVHYYTAKFFQHEKTKFTTTNFYADSATIEPNAFLPAFSNTMFDDLSTRESYEFSLNLEGELLQASLEGLQGDFITKNDPAYTRYLSVGTGKVIFDDRDFDVDVALEKIYSDDYGKYIFFPGMNELSSITHRILVWDEDGNFYLVDTSTVSKDNPYYRPHTWVLYKNGSTKSMQKFFEADVNFHEEGETKFWDILIPNFNDSLRLFSTDNTDADWSSGTVYGEVKTPVDQKSVFGSFSYKKK